MSSGRVPARQVTRFRFRGRLTLGHASGHHIVDVSLLYALPGCPLQRQFALEMCESRSEAINGHRAAPIPARVVPVHQRDKREAVALSKTCRVRGLEQTTRRIGAVVLHLNEEVGE